MTASGITLDIPVSNIFVDSHFNCRGPFLLQDVQELAAQIKRTGQLQEVIVQPCSDAAGKPYRLIAGFRRYAAIARILKWKTIRANVVEVDEVGAKTLNLIENLERENLNCVQEAKAMEAIYPQNRFGCREVAERLGRHTSWVLQRRKLLELPEDIQEKFASGRVGISRINLVHQRDDKASACRQLLKRKHPRAPLPGLKRRNMREIKRMIAYLIDCGMDGLCTRLLAWVNGYVSDDEINAEIERLLSEGR